MKDHRQLADANRMWAEMLARWEIPERLRHAAPASPYFFDPEVFAQAADDALAKNDDSPSDQAARAALPAGGSVLDIGCGAGAASLRLRPGRIVGVDSNRSMLDGFVTRATNLGIAANVVKGTWPDVAEACPNADVVVCHHVFYNVSDLAGFAAALDAHAGKRVVVELTRDHPMAWMAPYWLALHGLAQPDRPTVEDALHVLAGLGLRVQQRRWRRRYQMIGEHAAHALESMARRLCLPAERHPELRQLLQDLPPPTDREVVTLWW